MNSKEKCHGENWWNLAIISKENVMVKIYQVWEWIILKMDSGNPLNLVMENAKVTIYHIWCWTVREDWMVKIDEICWCITME